MTVQVQHNPCGCLGIKKGSHGTTEWLDRLKMCLTMVVDTFAASNSDGANGYDPAPKMALITVTGGADGETIVLDGGIDSILMVLTTDSGTSAVALVHQFQVKLLLYNALAVQRTLLMY